jgi:crotonobetainyl-CoA:carnitine CoA-transferase CaiB-like acyl-CoA transferase
VTPAAVRFPAPLLGQHSSEILLEAGYSEAEIEALQARRIIAGAG